MVNRIKCLVKDKIGKKWIKLQNKTKTLNEVIFLTILINKVVRQRRFWCANWFQVVQIQGCIAAWTNQKLKLATNVIDSLKVVLFWSWGDILQRHECAVKFSNVFDGEIDKFQQVEVLHEMELGKFIEDGGELRVFRAVLGMGIAFQIHLICLHDHWNVFTDNVENRSENILIQEDRIIDCIDKNGLR